MGTWPVAEEAKRISKWRILDLESIASYTYIRFVFHHDLSFIDCVLRER